MNIKMFPNKNTKNRLSLIVSKQEPASELEKQTKKTKQSAKRTK